MATNRRSASSFNSYADGIIMRGMPLLTLYPGDVYWVDENGGGSDKGTFLSPVASIGEALALCTSGNGDTIMVKPGHVENISSAGALDMNKSDIAVVGTGSGSIQAKIVFDTAAAACMNVTAANVSFVNMWFMSSFADVTSAINVSAAGDYFTIQGCRISNGTAATEFAIFLSLAVNADYFSFINNDVNLILGGGLTSFVITAGESLGMRVIGNTIVGPATACFFDLDATELTGEPLFMDNAMLNITAAADFVVEINASTVGLWVNERYACASEVVPIATTTNSFYVDCEASELADVGSLLFPATPTAYP